MLISVAIAATLAAIAIPVVLHYIDNAKIARVISEIRGLEKEILVYKSDNGVYPNTLNDIGQGTLPDAWGNAYEYQNIADANPPQGQMRKDRFLVPVNSDYDLYSRGKDGLTQKPFQAAPAKDDIVRANDGGYIGLASEF
jgi:general secretion pathway protein G